MKAQAQHTLTIDLDELKTMLKEKFKIDVHPVDLQVSVVTHPETRKDAIQLSWHSGQQTGDYWNR